MKKRIVIKDSDVFCAVIDNEYKMYFQNVRKDIMWLNSDVIVVFKTKYSLDSFPELQYVVRDEIVFYTHVYIRWGYKMGLWDKVGNTPYIGSTDFLFRETLDYGIKPGGKKVEISDRWRIWELGDEKWRDVTKLEGKYRTSEIGLVYNPESVIIRMKTGKYPGSYPDFK